MTATAQVLESLSRFGILPKQDKELPNVVTLLTGEKLSTSWWSHPKGKLIFRVLSELADHPDVVLTKLIAGKDTLVHRRLWPALVAVGAGGEAWQRERLSPGARGLLAKLDRSKAGIRASGLAVKELASRLLVQAAERHTESGRHEIVVHSWTSWARAAGVRGKMSATQGREALEDACRALGAPSSSLPWNRPRVMTASRASRARSPRAPPRRPRTAAARSPRRR